MWGEERSNERRTANPFGRKEKDQNLERGGGERVARKEKGRGLQREEG